MEEEKNMLHEFAKGYFDDMTEIKDVVEDILGSLGLLNKNECIVDATVDDRRQSILYELVAHHDMKFVDANNVSTGVNECIERSGMKDRVQCVVAVTPCTHQPPVLVLEKYSEKVPGYVKAYASDAYTVFVRRDAARRARLTSLQIMRD